MIDPTTLPACTIEDGSLPGQAFPCYWDAAANGNGIGTSFVMPALDTYLYADGTLLCPANTWANDALDGCEPLPADAPAPVQVDTTDTGVPVYATETLAAPPLTAHAELAHTGPTDPALWLAALLMVTIGAVLAPVGKRRRPRSS